jgi:TonB family protein
MRKELMEIEKIEQYLLGKMNGEEAKAFEQVMASDHNLAESVAVQKEMMEGLERVGLKTDAQTGYRRYKLKMWASQIGIALGVLIIGAGIWYFVSLEDKKAYCICSEKEMATIEHSEDAMPNQPECIDTCPPAPMIETPIIESEIEEVTETAEDLKIITDTIVETDTLINIEVLDDETHVGISESNAFHSQLNGANNDNAIQPEFPGGRNAMRQFIATNIRYPQNAFNQGITGTVEVSFSISETGQLGNYKIHKSVNNELDAEAMRIIKKMPKWSPGKVAGEPTSMNFILPIVFEIREE